MLWLAAGPRPAGAASANATVTASLADATVEMGQSTEYRIDVAGARADRAPAPPVVDGLHFVFAGQQQSMQFDQRTLSMNTAVSYIYTVDPMRGGRFTIPGQEVEVGGGTYRTLPVVLTVSDGGQGSAAKSVFVDLIVPKKSAYLGETIPVEVRTYFAMNVPAQLTPDLVLNGEGFSVQKFTPQKDVGQQAVDNTNYRVASAKSAITALKVGTLSVGPVEVDPYVQLPRPRQRRRSPFNDPFDALFSNGFNNMNLMPAQQIKLLSSPVTVEIKPLPTQGKPAEFTGAIGQFKLDAQTEPRKAQTGDPITVHLMLSGRGNFDRIGAPELSDEQGLRTYPASAKFKADDEVNTSGVKTFDQVLIAESARNTLPGYRFNYFDPATGKYATIDTPPIPIRVEGGNLTTPTPAPPLVAAAPSAPGATPKATPTPAPRRAEDILYIRTDEGPALARDAFQPLYRQRGFWQVQGGGLVLLLGLGAFGAVRTRARNEGVRRAAQRQREQAELQRALTREETPRREFYSAATRLAQMRAAAASGQPDARLFLSVQDICRDRQLDPQTAGLRAGDVPPPRRTGLRRRRTSRRRPVPPEERRGVLATLETLGRKPALRMMKASATSVYDKDCGWSSSSRLCHGVRAGPHWHLRLLSLSKCLRESGTSSRDRNRSLRGGANSPRPPQAYENGDVRQGECTANLFYNLG